MLSNRTRRVNFQAIAIVLLLGSPLFAESFQNARPVWLRGRETEKNLTAGFRAVFEAPAGRTVGLRLTGSTEYRVWLNGSFVGFGPARGPHGIFRIDSIELAAAPGKNVVAIEVAGYNVNSYALLDQPSFLQAELLAGDGAVLAATGDESHPFECRALDARVQKVQRYSFQRPFSEVYRLDPGTNAWRTDTSAVAANASAECAIQSDVALLPRGVPLPDYTQHRPIARVAEGELTTGIEVKAPWKDRSLTGIGPQLRGFPESELTTIPSIELQSVANSTRREPAAGTSGETPIGLKSNSYAIVDLGVNRTGFLRARITCEGPTRLFLTFDEILGPDGDVDFKRLGCVNIIGLELTSAGTYDFEAFEPYTLRYLKLLVLDGGARIEDVALRDLATPVPSTVHFASSDERLNRLFAAGVETFRQNAVDIFMDCPSRERAGWLCDSFFTARVADDLQADGRIEGNFLDNFRRPSSFAHLPAGMLPMCYPADHDDGVFIPNWSLWFVLQVEEYQKRTGDRELVAALRPRLEALLDYFARFRNSDGLLEKLEGWVFVEWSAANGFVQDVNYPSNMLYAAALAAMGRMYDRPELSTQAQTIRDTIRKQAFDGTFFVDNALRKPDGALEVTRNRTEVCQYFAFFFDVATPESHTELWNTLLHDFGPQRRQTGAHPEIHPANAFVGNTMRLELLSRAGLCRQLLDESLAYQLYMVDRTGTLWENDTPAASCDHGFASHGGVHVLFRDVLGLAEVDPVHKRIRLRFADQPLERCEGTRPLMGGGLVSLRWRKQGDRWYYHVEAPAGYRVETQNTSGLTLVAE
jgi:alpha-L-rhamnosidase